MAFFTDTADAPVVELRKREDRYYAFAIATATQYYQDVSIAEYEMRGLVDTTADAKIAALAADTSIAGGEKSPIGGGGYNVRWSTATSTGWDT